jgi:hypothetical protein
MDGQRPAHRPERRVLTLQLNGSDVGAAYTMREDERKMNIPPHWNNYVTVANVDESTKRAKELGAQVLAAPFDVMDAGRHVGAEGSHRRGVPACGRPAAASARRRSRSQVRSAGPSSRPATRPPQRSSTSLLLGWTPKHSVAAVAPMAYTEFTVQGGDRPWPA